MADELQWAALAYYSNLSREQREMAKKSFEKMDSDGNGTISLKGYQKHIIAYPGETTQMKLSSFNVVDKNGDGKLDYWEFITLYYLDKSGRLDCWCQGHACKKGTFLSGLYFACVTCFRYATESKMFYLCCSCYYNRCYTHKHDNFLDNYTFLQLKIIPDQTAATSNDPMGSGQTTSNDASVPPPERVSWREGPYFHIM